MNLIAVTITAAPDSDPKTFRTYDWRPGQPLEDLEVAVATLQDYIAKRRSDLATALASQPPIEIISPS